jgi:hypothetical protein
VNRARRQAENLLRKTILIPILFAGAALLLAQTPAGHKKKTPSKSTSTSASSKKTVTKSSTKSAAGKKSSARKTSGKKTTGSWRTTQRTPTPDRYKEIQQALASKGYLQASSPSGVWDTHSVEALKKFQQDQSLEPSGKIDSLSLIALGLGPKRDSPPVPQP